VTGTDFHPRVVGSSPTGPTGLTCAFVSIFDAREGSWGGRGHGLVTPFRHQGVGSFGGSLSHAFEQMCRCPP
jgi:hypothetical protein